MPDLEKLWNILISYYQIDDWEKSINCGDFIISNGIDWLLVGESKYVKKTRIDLYRRSFDENFERFLEDVIAYCEYNSCQEIN